MYISYFFIIYFSIIFYAYNDIKKYAEKIANEIYENTVFGMYNSARLSACEQHVFKWTVIVFAHETRERKVRVREHMNAKTREHA